jgi:hypothetical protein
VGHGLAARASTDVGSNASPWPAGEHLQSFQEALVFLFGPWLADTSVGTDGVSDVDRRESDDFGGFAVVGKELALDFFRDSHGCCVDIAVGEQNEL